MIDLANITSITADSRKVRDGSLFFAIKGAKSDGHDYIDKAIASGAAAIVGEKDLKLSVPYTESKNIRHELAVTAAAFYKNQPSKIAVITGTNGKTSTADFCRQFFEMAGSDSASIGTLGFIHGQENVEFDNTSPDPVIMHEYLAKVTDFAAIEGSSIGIEQHRLDGLKVTAAGFTNFTQDHLDYHGSMEEYFRCKTLLFTQVMQNGTAVINKELPKFDIGNNKLITFGNGADIELLKQTPTHDGQEITISIFGKKQDYKIGLVGKFQAENILCAIGLSFACGLRDFPIHKLQPIAGRMQQALPGIYVDYAHTPDALENALKALRPHTSGKLHVVFGCGGDRDKGKRPQMGKIAAQLADNVIVTDDNPRTEKPEVIRKEILVACPNATEIADRTTAIKTAKSAMKQGDILLIAGKGHEKYQIYGLEKQHFDDVEIAKK
jgi:UDP-N-acetylmuramoyl-L-alanyl-D-glutamate--2,6-diaminopimelate ligase